MRRRFGKRAAISLALLLSACGAPAPKGETAAGLSGCITDQLTQVGGPIALTRQDGVAVTEADFKGKPALVYFGFATCPDFCPTALQKLHDTLGPRASEIQTIFITIDPERDTAEKMSAYVASNGFPAGLVGLTGSKEAIAAAAKAFKVFHARVDDPSSAIGYTMDHSRFMYLTDASWRTVAMFRDALSPAEINACIASALAPAKPPG
jgi:protein SCO1/2